MCLEDVGGVMLDVHLSFTKGGERPSKTIFSNGSGHYSVTTSLASLLSNKSGEIDCVKETPDFTPSTIALLSSSFESNVVRFTN